MESKTLSVAGHVLLANQEMRYKPLIVDSSAAAWGVAVPAARSSKIHSGGHFMGANSTQAIGVLLFLSAFVLLAGMFAGWGIIAGLGFVLFLGASVAMFLKSKSAESSEESKG